MGFSDLINNRPGRRALPALIIFFTLAVGIALGTLVSQGVRASKEGGGRTAVPIAIPSPVQLSTSFASIAESIEPTVVNIRSESLAKPSSRPPRQQQKEQPFGDLFDRFFRSPEGGTPRRQSNLGSGVIVDEKGYILTNHHVVTQGKKGEIVDRIRVRLHGDEGVNQEYDARVIGTDRETDLAVIKIDAGQSLPHADFGDSESMRVGDWVLAVGSPFGLRSTVTAGIISAKGRGLEPGPQGQFKSYIQTDAAINPGNSGGPLINLAGQIIGINTAIVTRGRGSDGVGFAIPSKTALNVYNSIIKSGRVVRGSIGVTFNAAPNEALLRGFGIDHGIIINQVSPNSPASKAGMQRGDVILSVDGVPVNDGDDLVGIVAATPVGDVVKISVLRGRRKIILEVEIADRSILFAKDLGYQPEQGRDPSGMTEGSLGVSVRDLTPDQGEDIAKHLGLEKNTPGVLVVAVNQGKFGEDALGIRVNDVILEINRQPIRNSKDFKEMEGSLKPGMDVVVLVGRQRRGGFDTHFLAARMP